MLLFIYYRTFCSLRTYWFIVFKINQKDFVEVIAHFWLYSYNQSKDWGEKERLRWPWMVMTYEILLCYFSWNSVRTFKAWYRNDHFHCVILSIQTNNFYYGSSSEITKIKKPYRITPKKYCLFYVLVDLFRRAFFSRPIRLNLSLMDKTAHVMLFYFKFLNPLIYI